MLFDSYNLFPCVHRFINTVAISDCFVQKVKGGEPKGGSVLRPSPPVPPSKKPDPPLPTKAPSVHPPPPNKGKWLRESVKSKLMMGRF